jgi:hypothetical protein
MKSFYILMLGLALCILGCITLGPEVQGDDFSVSLNSHFVTIGEFDAQFIREFSFNSLRTNTVTVLYYPLEDAVCLQFRQGVTYHQFWSRSGRQGFINALTRYNEDFEARNLQNSRRTRQSYGIVRGYLIWQGFDFGVRANANMNVELGYTFNSRLPYFTIGQMEAQFVHPRLPGNSRNSEIVTIFLTRAQAAELADMFDQNLLREAAARPLPPPPPPPPPVQDDYY